MVLGWGQDEVTWKKLESPVDKMLTELGLDPYRRECDCVSEVNFRRLKAMLDAIDDVDHRTIYGLRR